MSVHTKHKRASIAAQIEPLAPPFGEAPNRMHDTRVAAACLGLATASLEVDRCRRRWKIPHFKIGGRVLYRESDLLAFLDRHRVGG
jgi:hypothetical protein